MVRPEPQRNHPPSHHDPMSPNDTPLVLLVDDEQRSLDAMRRTLEEDFAIATAHRRGRGARVDAVARRWP